MKKITYVFAAFALFIIGSLTVSASDEKPFKIGNEEFSSLKEAVESVPTDGTKATITMTKNVEKAEGVKVVSGQNIVIDFGGYTYETWEPMVGSKGTETQSFQLLKGSTVYMKNGNLIASTHPNSKMFIQNYSNLTLEDITINAETNTWNTFYALSSNNGTVNIIGNTNIKVNPNTNARAFDMCWAANKGYPDGTQITVDTTGTMNGLIELDTWGTFAENIKSTLTIKNLKFIGKFSIESRLADQIKITGGTFSTDASKYLAEGYEQNENGTVVKKEYKQEIDIPTIDLSKEVKEITYGIKDPEAVKSVLLSTLNKTTEIDSALLENKNIEIGIDIDDNVIVSSSVEEKFKGTLESKTKNAKIASYFTIDINVLNSDNDTNLGKLTEITDTIDITVALPEELQKAKDGYTRTFYILRQHNNQIEILDDITLAKDGKSLTFKTDKFSTYAIAYNDTKTETEANPSTLDNILLFVSLLILSSVGIIVSKRKLAK